MWNLMFSNHTVSLTGAAYVADSSWLTQDGNPSVMLDYSDTNNIMFREMYDEMRYMANNVWLGRIWWGVPTNSFKKRSYTKLGEAKDKALLAAMNTTAVHMSLWGSLVGDASREEVPLEGKFPLGWFAMQCVGPQAVPKLRYSAWAQWDVVRDLHHGYVAADYRLPALNGKEGAGKDAVSGPGYPNPGNDHDGKMVRWHIWPGKLSNVLALGNFTQWQPFEKETPVGRDDAWAVRVLRGRGGREGEREERSEEGKRVGRAHPRARALNPPLVLPHPTHTPPLPSLLSSTPLLSLPLARHHQDRGLEGRPRRDPRVRL